MIEQGAYILIAAGAFIFIISFLGYCGAIKESRVLLTAYGLFIIIIALLQITAIVLATVFRHAFLHSQPIVTEFDPAILTKFLVARFSRDPCNLFNGFFSE